MNKLCINILRNQWIEIASRWFLGLIFIYASIHKILDPAAFAKIVYGYGLFPGVLINLIAIILPFIELLTGLSLLTGVYRRSAAMIITGMLIAFILLISINLIRGHEFDCGCFSSSSNFLMSSSPWATLGRDLFLLLPGSYILKYKIYEPA